MALPSPLTFSESRWPVAAEALEQSMLESKDKEQLVAIAQALGIKTNARAAKATLIDKILETTRPAPPAPEPEPASTNGHGEANGTTEAAEPVESVEVNEVNEVDEVVAEPAPVEPEPKPARGSRSNGRAATPPPEVEQETLLGPDGEPL